MEDEVNNQIKQAIMLKLKIYLLIGAAIIMGFAILGFAVVAFFIGDGDEEESGSTSFAASEFLEVAKKCHDYLKENQYYYHQGNRVPYPNGTKGIDCSAYVTWALYEYGYTELEGHQKVSWQLRDMGKEGYAGWKLIDIEDIQPGDLVFRSSPHNHIEIYAGGELVLSCGSTKSIRAEYVYYGSREGYIDYSKGGNAVGIRITDPNKEQPGNEVLGETEDTETESTETEDTETEDTETETTET